MPIARKRKGSESESAVSKLRKAREQSTPVSTREASPIAEALATSIPPVSRNGRSRNTARQGQKLVEVPGPSPQSVSELRNDNGFSHLPYETPWEGNRTFERLSNQRLRIELAEGIGFVVVGECTVWVKHGSVYAEGAVLNAGPVLHHLSATDNFPLPMIQAWKGAAELELGVNRRHTTSSDRYMDRLRVLTKGSDISEPDLPYRVLGLDFHLDDSTVARPAIASVAELQLERLLTKSFHRSQSSCVLLSGSGATTTHTLTRWTMNTALSIPPASATCLLLDLDSTLPVFTAPGMIALCKVKDPVLSPRPLHGGSNQVEVVRQHFVGPTSIDPGLNTWSRGCVTDLLSALQESRASYPKALVLVNLGRAGVCHEEATMEQIWASLVPTSIAQTSAQGLPPAPEKLQLLAERDDVSIHSLPQLPAMRHARALHEISLRSYVGSGIDHIIQYDGPDASLLQIVSIEATLPPTYLERALPGALVAVNVVGGAALDAVRSHAQVCPTSRLQYLPPLSEVGLSAKEVQCIGVGRIRSIDVERGCLTFRSAIAEAAWRTKSSVDAGVLLIVQPPTRDGRFQLG